jgi:hypothetical protein
MLALAYFEESDSWWFLAGFSDNVSHILVAPHHGGCSRAVTRGLDRHVLDGVNAWSLAGFGWESFAWVRFTGFTDGVLSMGYIIYNKMGLFVRARRPATDPADRVLTLSLPYPQWKFRCSMSSVYHEGGPRSSRSSGFNNPSTWFTH